MIQGEPQRIYHALFGTRSAGGIPPVLERRYREAAALLDGRSTAEERSGCEWALAADVDLEALELVARYTRRLPLLTKKLQLMAYLAETLPANQRLYVNRRSNLLAGVAEIASAVLRTIYKMTIGLWTLRKVRA